MQDQKVKIIECPRDAMQGWPHFIPTASKISYINALLKAGFDTIDFGSFVSPKAIPQMADTSEVIRSLDVPNNGTKLLAIIANTRGAQDAVMFDQISYLGYPFSISETFQRRNTNADIASSLETVRDIQELCIKNRKTLVVYISMGFGNPYGDVYNEDIVLEWTEKLVALDIRIISVADTVGIAAPEQVSSVIRKIIPAFPDTEVGVHLHAASNNREAKLQAAIDAGCKRFDGAIKGIGGCPMAGNELVGNMDTEFMVSHFNNAGIDTGVDIGILQKCSEMASGIFI